jgi:D-amino-acid dehydrogenase
MPSHSVDVIVLGAGIVGVSAALALQSRGRTVALVDRLPEAAGETSFGNSGIVQTEGVLPYLFPRAIGEVARAAVNRDPRAHMRHGSLPSIAPAIWRYFRASTQPRKAATGKVMAPLLFAAAAEHVKLAQDQSLSQRARARAGACRGRGAQSVRRQADAS